MGIALVLFVVGLVAGAFANAVALDTSVSAAATTIPPGDHESVQPLRMPVILAVTGLLFAATPWVVGVSWVLPAYLWFVWLTVTLTMTDLDDKLIPNRILFPGAGVGGLLLIVGAGLDGQPEALIGGFVGGVVYFVVLYGIARMARGEFGLGDVKLAFLLGVFTAYQGWDELFVAFVAAFVLGGVVSLAFLVTRTRNRKDAIPFGPFLVAGAYIGLAWGANIVAWYLGASP
jgi:leader peptidase (prepilin peptidase)/N-methyltransferase